MDAVTRMTALLPAELRERLGPLPDDLTELRLRAGRPVQLIGLRRETIIEGEVSASLVRSAAQALAGHSLYAREEELSILRLRAAAG